MKRRVHLATAVASVTRGFNIGAVCGNRSNDKDVYTFQEPFVSQRRRRLFRMAQTMERQQLESERKMQALLQETMRLREENVVLRIQVSSSGPPHDQQSRGQGVNSRPNLESVNPGTTRVIPDMRDERSWERPMPTYHAPQDESLDSTRLSSKRQRDKRPQLSDAMRARLGPQEPGKERPPTAAT